MNIIWWLILRSKTEIKIVLTTLGILFILPTVALVVLASSSLAAVGSALAAVNPVTHLVEIFDPNGHTTRTVKLSTVWPARGVVSDEFGAFEAFRKEAGLGPHTGIDIANEKGQTGAPITTFMTGTVTEVHTSTNGDCGIYVRINHGNGITSLYCHMIGTATTVGTVVNPGDVIGYVGSTGASTGAHVHFQTMVYSIPVNPRIFMVGNPKGTNEP